MTTETQTDRVGAATTKLRRLLESALPHPAEIEPGVLYMRLQDDHDGTYEGLIGVAFSRDGDAHVQFTESESGAPLRFRTILGGGASPRTRNALVLLALAMKLDADEEKAAKERRAAQKETLAARRKGTRPGAVNVKRNEGAV
jgi:hypothetical protein